MTRRPKVIIVGGGFGGLCAARAPKSAPVDVTLPVDVTVIDRHNYHLFQPLRYQVATGSLSPGESAAPLPSVFSRQKNTRVLLGEVKDIDPVSKSVLLADGATFEYDSLIVVAGSEPGSFRVFRWGVHSGAIQDLTFSRGARLITGTATTDFNFDRELASVAKKPAETGKIAVNA